MRLKVYLLFSCFSICLISANAKSSTTVNLYSQKNSSCNGPGDPITPMWLKNVSLRQSDLSQKKKMIFFSKGTWVHMPNNIKYDFKKNSDKEESTGTNWGGLLLGTFLGPIGVIGAYVFSKDRNFRKWTWKGFAIFIAAAGIGFATYVRQM